MSDTDVDIPDDSNTEEELEEEINQGNIKKYSTPTRMLHAMQMLEDGRASSQVKAALGSEVKRSTLNEHINGKRLPTHVYHKSRKALTSAEEQVLVERIEDQQDLEFPPEVYKIHHFARDIFRRQGVNVSNKKCTQNWFAGFKLYHPDVATTWSKQLNYVSIFSANNSEAMTKYFQMLDRVLNKYNICTHNIYNMDECGFLMGFGESAQVITSHPRKYGTLWRKQNGFRVFATVLACICADGTAVATMIIHAAKYFNLHWVPEDERGMGDAPEDVLIGKSPNSWTDQKMSLGWLEKHFGRESWTAEKAGGEHQLLMFDGHNSHVNYSFFLYGLENRVIPFCLPPHTSLVSHWMKPCSRY